jgi:hypothetical protein
MSKLQGASVLRIRAGGFSIRRIALHLGVHAVLSRKFGDRSCISEWFLAAAASWMTFGDQLFGFSYRPLPRVDAPL